ncbi:oxysterol binding protein [Coprinopsis cinerea okayama7|uniref:Oxysterol binding protein n=1 Tax=Coprinopsis cinerea (strain Okayama-7 / 130 / ATCC MYA-4618 / FGSC 9003) TaxID=240176 RepID=A8NJM5_COPC7|nr:oxysterol binding protein [Coprinopsis cinerea okayama7\|eukprot:XP_001834262.2 oxysterol binding protein [Coprinopsis cinerea okayama7\
MATETVGDAVPASQRGSWSSFLKSIASFSGDLSSLTAPPFILSPTSLTEFPAYWCERPDLFAAIADAKEGEERHLAVLKWFISTLKDQYTSRNEELGSEKKPLNPVLGELFYAYWPDKNGRGQTNLLVEQVSHHPPITAYVIENKTKGLKLVGHNAQKTTFSAGSVIVKQIGHAVLTVKGVEYVITLPRLRIDGLWYGSPYIELIDSNHIIGENFVSLIEYKGKGYFSGKSHSFKATVSPASAEAPVAATSSSSGGGLGAWVGYGSKNSSSTSLSGKEHVVEGTWHETSSWVKGAGKGKFHDSSIGKEDFVVVGGEPNGEMGEFETRKLWNLVAKGIREGDFELASTEKSKIENDQRQRRKDEAAANTKWALKHFKHEANDPIYERLGKFAKINPPTEDRYTFVGNWPPSLA